MQKTTVYLPDDLKAAVARAARQRSLPEAEIIRQAVAAAMTHPAPTPGLFTSDAPIASRVDELLKGFGER